MQLDSKSVSLAAAAFAAALPFAAHAAPAPVPQYTVEKCYGIAAAAENDCQTATHSCAGKSKQARDKEFVDLRAGRHLRQDRRRQPQKGLTEARASAAIVTRVGIGLRSPHVAAIAALRPPLDFLEVHAENYMAETMALDRLLELRSDYPVSLHGVALSLGERRGTRPRTSRPVQGAYRTGRADAGLRASGMECDWGSVFERPLAASLYRGKPRRLFCRHVEEAQDALGRRLLIENPSSYLRYRHSSIPEAEFLAEVARRTGCGILCDVNNIYVSARNFGFDPLAYLDTLPAEMIGEIHLAGHHAAEDVDILIDDHGSRVAEPVWELYAEALRRLGPVPSLIEWDTDLPALEVLLDEARHAQELANVRGHLDTA